MSAGIGTVNKSEQRFRLTWAKSASVSRAGRIHSGALLPEGWPQHRELEYTARQVRSIEINGSFYSLQRPESYRAWYEATPEGFAFSQTQRHHRHRSRCGERHMKNRGLKPLAVNSIPDATQ